MLWVVIFSNTISCVLFVYFIYILYQNILFIDISNQYVLSVSLIVMFY